MKKIILLLTVVSIFAACKNNSNSPLYNKNLVLVDTTGLSRSNALTDVGNKNNSTVPRTWGTTTTQNSRASSHAIYPDNGTTATTTTTTTTSSVPKRDKGWSSAAKGTAIGAGTGAIVGAIVGKNAKGAIIGAIVGGGTGYVIGRGKDRKSGRVARAKARRAAGY